MSDELSSMTLHVGAFNGATELPYAHVPTALGGITVLEALLFSPGAGTAIGGLLVTFGNVATGGTPAINGTIGSFAGTIVTAAGVVHKATISTPFVANNYFIGYDQTSGTIPAGSFIQVNYVTGK
jgi:hypothetical protein